MFLSVTKSSGLSTDASPTVCLPSSDNLKVDRNRRKQQEQEQFLEQLKEKQLTNGKDLQSKSSVDKNTGLHYEYFLVRCRWQYRTQMDFNAVNLLKPNDIYICHNATLTSRCYILNIYSTNIHTEYFKHAA